MPSESLLVFSDVHLGSDLDDCQRTAPRRSRAIDEDLVALLSHYRRTRPEADRWHIVVAGDFIDFIGMSIVAPPTLDTELTDEERMHGLGGAPDHAREKLRRVAERHADVLAALAAFVADGHALTLVHGNHDIEFHWDVVKDDFRAILLEHARAASGDLDHDAFLARIQFNPWFFWRDGVVFIEHGHQYDPYCATPFVMAPLSPLDPRRIVRDFSNVLIRHVVRPTRGMLQSGHEHAGMLDYVAFGAKLGLRGLVALGLRFARAVRELFRLRSATLSKAAEAIRAEHESRMSRLAAATRIGVDRLRSLVALQATPITSTIRGILASVLLDRLALALVWITAIAILATSGVLGPYTVPACIGAAIAWTVAHVLVSRQRIVDPAAKMIERAAHLANLFPAAFVVMGHTHVPVSVRAGDATYINVGSWAEDEAEPAAATRTHLVIDVGPNGAAARFCAWSPEGPRPLA